MKKVTLILDPGMLKAIPLVSHGAPRLKLGMHILLQTVYLIAAASLEGSLVSLSLRMLGHRPVHPANLQKVVMLNNWLWPSSMLKPPTYWQHY
jgi:hypothetical protein